MIKQYAKGEIIAQEGQHLQCAFIVDSGRVELLEHGEDGMESVASIIGPDQIFGEMSLIFGVPFANTARALEECQITLLTRESYQSMLE